VSVGVVYDQDFTAPGYAFPSLTFLSHPSNKNVRIRELKKIPSQDSSDVVDILDFLVARALVLVNEIGGLAFFTPFLLLRFLLHCKGSPSPTCRLVPN